MNCFESLKLSQQYSKILQKMQQRSDKDGRKKSQLCSDALAIKQPSNLSKLQNPLPNRTQQSTSIIQKKNANIDKSPQPSATPRLPQTKPISLFQNKTPPKNIPGLNSNTSRCDLKHIVQLSQMKVRNSPLNTTNMLDESSMSSVPSLPVKSPTNQVFTNSTKSISAYGMSGFRGAKLHPNYVSNQNNTPKAQQISCNQANDKTNVHNSQTNKESLGINFLRCSYCNLKRGKYFTEKENIISYLCSKCAIQHAENGSRIKCLPSNNNTWEELHSLSEINARQQPNEPDLQSFTKTPYQSETKFNTDSCADNKKTYKTGIEDRRNLPEWMKEQMQISDREGILAKFQNIVTPIGNNRKEEARQISSENGTLKRESGFTEDHEWQELGAKITFERDSKAQQHNQENFDTNQDQFDEGYELDGKQSMPQEELLDEEDDTVPQFLDERRLRERKKVTLDKFSEEISVCGQQANKCLVQLSQRRKEVTKFYENQELKLHHNAQNLIQSIQKELIDSVDKIRQAQAQTICTFTEKEGHLQRIAHEIRQTEQDVLKNRDQIIQIMDQGPFNNIIELYHRNLQQNYILLQSVPVEVLCLSKTYPISERKDEMSQLINELKIIFAVQQKRTTMFGNKSFASATSTPQHVSTNNNSYILPSSSPTHSSPKTVKNTQNAAQTSTLRTPKHSLIYPSSVEISPVQMKKPQVIHHQSMSQAQSYQIKQKNMSSGAPYQFQQRNLSQTQTGSINSLSSAKSQKSSSCSNPPFQSSIYQMSQRAAEKMDLQIQPNIIQQSKQNYSNQHLCLEKMSVIDWHHSNQNNNAQDLSQQIIGEGECTLTDVQFERWKECERNIEEQIMSFDQTDSCSQLNNEFDNKLTDKGIKNKPQKLFICSAEYLRNIKKPSVLLSQSSEKFGLNEGDNYVIGEGGQIRSSEDKNPSPIHNGQAWILEKERDGIIRKLNLPQRFKVDDINEFGHLGQDRMVNISNEQRNHNESLNSQHTGDFQLQISSRKNRNTDQSCSSDQMEQINGLNYSASAIPKVQTTKSNIDSITNQFIESNNCYQGCSLNSNAFQQIENALQQKMKAQSIISDSCQASETKSDGGKQLSVRKSIYCNESDRKDDYVKNQDYNSFSNKLLWPKEELYDENLLFDNANEDINRRNNTLFKNILEKRSNSKHISRESQNQSESEGFDLYLDLNQLHDISNEEDNSNSLDQNSNKPLKYSEIIQRIHENYNRLSQNCPNRPLSMSQKPPAIDPLEKETQQSQESQQSQQKYGVQQQQRDEIQFQLENNPVNHEFRTNIDFSSFCAQPDQPMESQHINSEFNHLSQQQDTINNLGQSSGNFQKVAVSSEPKQMDNRINTIESFNQNVQFVDSTTCNTHFSLVNPIYQGQAEESDTSNMSQDNSNVVTDEQNNDENELNPDFENNKKLQNIGFRTYDFNSSYNDQIISFNADYIPVKSEKITYNFLQYQQKHLEAQQKVNSNLQIHNEDTIFNNMGTHNTDNYVKKTNNIASLGGKGEGWNEDAQVQNNQYEYQIESDDFKESAKFSAFSSFLDPKNFCHLEEQINNHINEQNFYSQSDETSKYQEFLKSSPSFREQNITEQILSQSQGEDKSQKKVDDFAFSPSYQSKIFRDSS